MKQQADSPEIPSQSTAMKGVKTPDPPEHSYLTQAWNRNESKGIIAIGYKTGLVQFVPFNHSS